MQVELLDSEIVMFQWGGWLVLGSILPWEGNEQNIRDRTLKFRLECPGPIIPRWRLDQSGHVYRWQRSEVLDSEAIWLGIKEEEFLEELSVLECRKGKGSP